MEENYGTYYFFVSSTMDKTQVYFINNSARINSMKLKFLLERDKAGKIVQ